MDIEPEIIEKWERERVLGCGGFGIVTLWKNNETNEKIAIKKYRGDNHNLSQKHKERWTQEVEMMQRITNENIVAFVKLPGIFEETLNKYNASKLPMLSMEYCTEGDLRSVLTRQENCCGLPESDVRYILKDLMNAVSYLHALKITHRDLKPENIVLQTCDRPNGIIYKLIDLGYAKELDAKSICASFVGTLQYLAPELLYSKSYSCSVDYWSMGLVAFEIICGTRPFLPNKSPAQWMYHVHKKSPDTICIYQEDESDDTIKYLKEIYPENHVSSCFKRYIEKWLQLALEYNPRERGYINYKADNPHNELAIFSHLKTLLEKKIITIFSVYTCEFCSYEIDDCTLVATVQCWIERDTKLTITEQLLLSLKCENIDMDGLATQFFDQTYAFPMLYVFKKTDILMMDIRPKFIPNEVQQMLQDSTKDLQYYFQKRAYAHALYFIYHETNLYNTVLDACNLRIKNIVRICDNLSHTCRNMNIAIEKLNAQKDFSKEILDFDHKNYLKNYSQNADHWNESMNVIIAKIDKLHGVCDQLTIRHESAFRRASNLSVYSNKEFSKHNNHTLNDQLEKALDLYRLIRTKSKENKSKPETCRQMTSILYSALKHRDTLLRHQTFRKYLQVIVDIDHETKKMVPPVKSAIEHIEKFRHDLMADHLSRQTKIWEFTIKNKQPKHKNATTESTKTHFNIGYPKPNEYGTSISLEKPLHFILGDSSRQNSSLESNSSYHSLSPIPPFNKNDADKENVQTISNKQNSNIEINTLKNKTISPDDNKVMMTCETIKTKPNLGKVETSKEPLKTNTKQLGNDINPLMSAEKQTISLILPNFVVGQPASIIIKENLYLRHELKEKTHQSLLQYNSILNDPLDFSFLEE